LFDALYLQIVASFRHEEYYAFWCIGDSAAYVQLPLNIEVFLFELAVGAAKWHQTFMSLPKAQ